ncbi:MAG: hypothetical protein Q9186_006609 [Xanthomendoza sp. 1 TL-2023]
MSETFDWTYPGLNWHHFHSLANLLALRNGGQVEPSLLSDTSLLEEDCNLDDEGEEDAHSTDTRVAHRISDSGHGRLKQRFLDFLAVFAANEKGGNAVSCSAMKEAEDNVVIWIARNRGFLDVDKLVFDNLGKTLGLLSGNSAEQAEVLLWEQMVSYHQKRIEDSYIPELRASFKAYDADRRRDDTDTPENSSISDDTLSILRTLLFESSSKDTSTLEKHTKLVLASYKLRRTKEIEVKLYSCPGATSRSWSLWVNVCLLARLRVAFQVFKDIALTLPSFEQVEIILVPCPLVPANPSGPLNLKQAFGILQLDLDPATTKSVLGQDWTVAKIGREFAKRQKQKPNVHAEVQMLMFFNTNESSSLGLFPYFGCSKLSCFMCDRFLQSDGRFTTKGSHGHLFKPWTVPSLDRLLPGQADRTAKALIAVQKGVKEKLKASLIAHIQHERTSVIGGSSVLDSQKGVPSEKHLQIERLRMKAERDRVAEMFRSDSCQRKSYGRHLFTCSKRPLTSADYLWEALGQDLMPQDDDVLKDFGFNNVLFGLDQTKLFGVYRGLYLSGKFSAEDIHVWRSEGSLAEKIKEFYFDIAESSRGRYFPWLLENLHVLGRPMNQDESQQLLIASFRDKARRCLDIKDRNEETAKSLKPRAKATSYSLLARVLHQISPNPIEESWYSFGFVTCRGENEEGILVALYQLLLTGTLTGSDGNFFYDFYRGNAIQPVTFTQFWEAYEEGTLNQLIDSKGLKELRSRLPFLEGFLSVPPGGPHLSVWDLKQFLEINDPTDLTPCPSVIADYGFHNCATDEETCTLMEIYKEVLRTANPLDLHQACVAGELFRFANDYVRMKDSWRPLMRNCYPLKML